MAQYKIVKKDVTVILPKGTIFLCDFEDESICRTRIFTDDGEMIIELPTKTIEDMAGKFSYIESELLNQIPDMN